MSKIVIVKDKTHLLTLIQQEIKLKGSECDLNHLDISQLNDFSNLFYYSKFNGDISKWNTSNVTDMSWMFNNSQFNGDISQWNISGVTDMSCMFYNLHFTGDISAWDTSRVIDISLIFHDCSAARPDQSAYKEINDRIKAIEEYRVLQDKQQFNTILPTLDKIVGSYKI